MSSAARACAIAVGGAVAIGLAVAVGSSAPVSSAQDPTTTSLVRLPRAPGVGETCRRHDGESALVIPLHADDNGIFLVDIGVEDAQGDTQWIKAAVDTGSEALLVAGEGCSGCEEGLHLGTVKQDGEEIRRSTIRYGSQQDTVVWRNKQIRIPAWLHTCDPTDTDGAHTDTVQCIVGDCPCAIVESRTGTSDYNILGLGSQNPHGPPAVLATLFPKTPRAFEIHVHSSEEARLILHRPHGKGCREPRYRFAVKDKSLGHAHHYLVSGSTPTLFQAGPIGGVNTGHIVNNKTFDVLFDTGSNAISLPESIYNAVHDMSYNKGVLELSFRTIDQKETMTLRIDYDRRDRFNAQVLKSHSDMIIVGITFLQGHSIGFEDDGTHRIMTFDYI